VVAKIVYLGIDPGANGGLAALYADPSDPTEVVDVKFKTMPDTELEIYEWILGLEHGVESRAVIEWINPAMYGTDKASMSKLYGSYMALRMALVAASFSFIAEKPQVWQKVLGIPHRKKTEKTSAWKGRLKKEAEEWFPQLHITLATSDALLIAQYCRLRFGGEPCP